ncbi:MAG: hypothetical protein ABJH45_00385 [Paracoccaceae bacterium]
MDVFLDGVAVRYYRGIGEEIQYVAPFSKMNFFIGANNSGKSIFLNLLASHLRSVADGNMSKTLDGLEEHRGEKSGRFFVALGKSKQGLLQQILVSNEQKLSVGRQQIGRKPEDQVATVLD